MNLYYNTYNIKIYGFLFFSFTLETSSKKTNSVLYEILNHRNVY